MTTKPKMMEGMRKYKNCKDAPPYLIFDRPPTNEFTMEGVRFPVRITAFVNGKVVYSKIHKPGEKVITLPEGIDLVVESPVCSGN